MAPSRQELCLSATKDGQEPEIGSFVTVNVDKLTQQRDSQRAERLPIDHQVTENELAFCQVDGSPLLPHSVSQA